jgi:hypothetical protein
MGRKNVVGFAIAIISWAVSMNQSDSVRPHVVAHLDMSLRPTMARPSRHAVGRLVHEMAWSIGRERVYS